MGKQGRVSGYSEEGMVHPCSWLAQLCVEAKDKSHQKSPETMDKKAHRFPHYPTKVEHKEATQSAMGMEKQDITNAKIHTEKTHQARTLRTFREKEEYLRLKSRNL